MSPLEESLKRHRQDFTTVLPPNLQFGKPFIMDLSADSPLFIGVDIQDTHALINQTLFHLNKHQAVLAIGCYNENRTLYQRSSLFTTENGTLRTLHLGIDLMVPPETPITAPYSGIVHDFKNNSQHGDYGPVVLLRHEIDNQIFFTLYGHLSTPSLNQLSIGKKINKGEAFASVGNFQENGNWPPHLHFQIIDNVENVTCDYPGVIEPKLQEKFLKICPNPNLILNIPALENE